MDFGGVREELTAAGASFSAAPVRRLAPVGRGVGEWWAGVRAVPGSLWHRALTPWRVLRGGPRAARAELEAAADRREALTRGLLRSAVDVARMEPITGTPLLLLDAHRHGSQAALDRRDEALGRLAPDVAVGLVTEGAADTFASARAASFEESYRASASSAAQAARLRDHYAALEASNEGRTVIAGSGSRAVFRDAAKFADEFGGAPEDWIKVAGRRSTRTDGAIVETHWVEHVGTGFQTEVKQKVQGWLGVPR